MQRQWNPGHVSWEENRDAAQMFKDEIRKARAKLELSLVRNVKNTTGFYRYMRQKRKIKIKCAQTQTNTINNTGEIVTTNMEKAEILTIFLPEFSLVIILLISLKSLGIKDGRRKSLPS